ncbi:lipopolysaccharide kinase InaA family protein [Kiritimatiellaeota bacterium B1221]|nr:lipopolysaccharide kinase InaA family protein [Kiritimatiellaeota bacterium B1221]
MSTFEKIGRFQGEIHPEYDHPEMRAWLAKLPDVPECADFPTELSALHCVRAPGTQADLKSFASSDGQKPKPRTQSMAMRAFQHACHLRRHGAPTPSPIAWLEYREGNQIREQYLISACLKNVCTFREALIHHYYEKPLCKEIMNLLSVSAQAVRKLHDAGFQHRNLCNQNILVRRDEQGQWAEAWITDLQGGKRFAKLTPAMRGQDNAKITLPSDLRRVFFEMQTEPLMLDDAFLSAEKHTRKQLQSKRKIQKVCKTLKKNGKDERPLPSEKDIWIWDDRSMQAIPALKSRDKRKYYRKKDLVDMASVYIRYRTSIRKAFKDLREQAWTKQVEMNGKIGMSINLEPERFEKERRWLESLGPLPLLVRLYHHESDAHQRYAMDAVRKLNAEGHLVTVALVQDRRAVTHPTAWKAFVDKAGGGLSGFVQAFEVGHAINRVKWGIWNVPEYRNFITPFIDWHKRFPQIPLMGPAGIDFEYPRVLPLLNQWPKNSLSAFSHHLYVDRRGDPENRQSGYDTVNKLALARAMARVHPACEERVVVSEVNWPLQGTGVWSPVGSPYQSPGERTNDPSVDEETYARYMKKYLLLALCSGMADQVYWWNLAAHGFGLIDDRDPNGWRPRPAFHAFKSLVDATRDATFIERKGDTKKYRYQFVKNDQTFEL